jgi:hypothetical protein
MIVDNHRYNAEHQTSAANFYFTDFIDDKEVSRTLFAAIREWARERSLGNLIGPLFSGATYGGGCLIEGFEHDAAMTMMPYNHAYYHDHYVANGFEKRFDLNSLGIDPQQFQMPERVERLAQRVRDRGRMRVIEFENKRSLRRAAKRVAALYNETLGDHSENYPLTEDELDQLINELLQIAQPDLEKIITYDDEVIGFMLAFPDVTPALQRAGGRLSLTAILDLLRSVKRSRKLLLNGMGIKQQYQRLGGNALIYSEIARTVKHTHYDFADAEMVQINEETDLMLRDMYNLGATRRKLHRVFQSRL